VAVSVLRRSLAVGAGNGASDGTGVGTDRVGQRSMTGVMRETRATRAGPTSVAGRGDDAFTQLYRSQRDRLRRIAYLMVGQAAVAEEIVQDAFLRVHGRWETIESHSAYLRMTVVNLCLAWRSRAALARERMPYGSDSVGPPELDETWTMLEQLPRNQRVALVLRYYEDLPIDEIAQVMRCRPATVRTRIHRALKALRKEIAS
jgi:RNA polymerase sigma factor (sigma-70 family)